MTTAEVTGIASLGALLAKLGTSTKLLCDSGYTGEPFAEGMREILGKPVTVQITRRIELYIFKFMSKRWIIERSFTWLEESGRLWKNCERKLNTSLQFIHLVFLVLLFKRS